MRMFIFLGGVLMAASWGLTWIEPPFAGADLSPMALILLIYFARSLLREYGGALV